MENTREFGLKVKRLRKSLGLTQAQLAQKVGVHSQTIADYETGRRRPTFNGIKDLAAALSVMPQDLVDSEVVVKPAFAPMKVVAERIASIPDDIYEMAQAHGSTSDVWDLVRGVFKVYERDLEDRVKDVKKG